MLQDPISKPPSVQMEVPRGTGPDNSRRNKPNSGNSEQVIKCPRCDSLNTKFCYYNNYSLTQPRHFCKNCRRYWTQGGSLRNVPIGGGCRKNKRVKQRTVDPHLFGGIDDHSSFLQHAASGAPGSFLSGSCYVGGPPVPGFVDLVHPSNDSHLLSMAFSRIQESLRLSTDQHAPAAPIGGAKQLSLMQQHPNTGLYDDAGLDVGDGYVRPDHHHMQQIFNGAELGSGLFEHPPSSGAHLGSSLPGGGSQPLVPSLEHQLCTMNFGVQDSGAFPSCGSQGHDMADAHLKLVHQQRQQALALHLGASEHHMQNPTSCSSATGAIADECGVRSSTFQAYPSAERYMDFHHRHQLALPDFEDQESPESMNSMMLRRGHIHAADKLVKGSVMQERNMGSSSCSAVQEERVESWQQISNSHTEQAPQQLQFAGGVGAAARKLAADEQQAAAMIAARTQTSSAAGTDQGHISFWSPSPWATSNQDVHTSALL